MQMAMSPAEAAARSHSPQNNNAKSRVATRSLAPTLEVVSPTLSSQQLPALDPLSPACSHPDARGDASGASRVAPVPSSVSSRSVASGSLQCSREQEDIFGSVAEHLPPEKYAELLAAFTSPSKSLNQQTVDEPQQSIVADRAVAARLAQKEASVARVEPRVKAVSLTSRAAAHANLLCAEEAATEYDCRARAADHQARGRVSQLLVKVESIKARQRAAAAAEQALRLEFDQTVAASEATSGEAARVAEAGASQRASHVDAVRVRRPVVNGMPPEFLRVASPHLSFAPENSITAGPAVAAADGVDPRLAHLPSDMMGDIQQLFRWPDPGGRMTSTQGGRRSTHRKVFVRLRGSESIARLVLPLCRVPECHLTILHRPPPVCRPKCFLPLSVSSPSSASTTPTSLKYSLTSRRNLRRLPSTAVLHRRPTYNSRERGCCRRRSTPRPTVLLLLLRRYSLSNTTPTLSIFRHEDTNRLHTTGHQRLRLSMGRLHLFGPTTAPHLCLNNTTSEHHCRHRRYSINNNNSEHRHRLHRININSEHRRHRRHHHSIINTIPVHRRRRRRRRGRGLPRCAIRDNIFRL